MISPNACVHAQFQFPQFVGLCEIIRCAQLKSPINTLLLGQTGEEDDRRHLFFLKLAADFPSVRFRHQYIKHNTVQSFACPDFPCFRNILRRKYPKAMLLKINAVDPQKAHIIVDKQYRRQSPYLLSLLMGSV